MADPNPAGELNIILSELRDTNKDKRRLAVMKLGMLGGDEAVNHLIRIMENEYEDTIVRGKAALMLGKIGDDRAILPLIKALEAPGYQTPLNAVEALGRLGDQRAVKPLITLAEHSKDRLYDAAVLALHRLGFEYVSNAVNNQSTLKEPEPEL